MWFVAAYLWDCCDPPSRAKKGTRHISRTSKENKDVIDLMNDFGTDYILKLSYFGHVLFPRECYYTRSHQFLSLVEVWHTFYLYSAAFLRSFLSGDFMGRVETGKLRGHKGVKEGNDPSVRTVVSQPPHY